jgi:hypothetical protein
MKTPAVVRTLLGALIIETSAAISFAITFATLNDPNADLVTTQATGIGDLTNGRFSHITSRPAR